MVRFSTFLLAFNKSKGLQQTGIFLVLSATAYKIAVTQCEVELYGGRIKIKPYRGSLKLFVEIRDHNISDEEIIIALKEWFIKSCEAVLNEGIATVAKKLDCAESDVELLQQEKDHLDELFTLEATNDLVSIFDDFTKNQVQGEPPTEPPAVKVMSSHSTRVDDAYESSKRLLQLGLLVLEESDFMRRLSIHATNSHDERRSEMISRILEVVKTLQE